MSDNFHDALIEIEDRVHRARAELETAEEVRVLVPQIPALEVEIESLTREVSLLTTKKSLSSVTDRLAARRRRIRLFSAWCLTALLAGVWALAHVASFQSEVVDEPRAHGDVQHWPVPFDSLRTYVVTPVSKPNPKERAKLEANF